MNGDQIKRDALDRAIDWVNDELDNYTVTNGDSVLGLSFVKLVLLREREKLEEER